MRFGLTVETIHKINTVFSKHPSVEKVIIYGSRAKGNYKNGSDIDLTLLGQNISERDLMYIRSELDDMLTPYSFDLSLYQKIDHPDLLDHIKRVGCVFYSSHCNAPPI